MSAPPADPATNDYPDGVTHPEKYVEGATRRVVVNAYERDRSARAACLAHYGTTCVICHFDFEATYGQIGKGVIHVHHLKALSKIGKSYRIDPIKDLRPVCPNCHTIIHKAKPQLSIDQARALVRKTLSEQRVGTRADGFVAN